MMASTISSKRAFLHLLVVLRPISGVLDHDSRTPYRNIKSHYVSCSAFKATL